MFRRRLRAIGVIAALASSAGCVKKSAEIRVHDAGRVALDARTPGGGAELLPPDGADRVVTILQPGTEQQVIAAREKGRIAVIWSDSPSGLEIVDAGGVLPRTPSNQGLTIHQGRLFATYNLTSRRILPERDQPSGSIPVVVSTPLANVAEAREIREPRRWPAYVFLPIGGVFTMLGSGLLFANDKETKVAGGVYFGAGAAMLVYGILNALASEESGPLEIPGRPGP